MFGGYFHPIKEFVVPVGFPQFLIWMGLTKKKGKNVFFAKQIAEEMGTVSVNHQLFC